MFQRHSFTARLMLLTVAFAWGATFVFVKAALAEIGPFASLAARFWLAFAVPAVPFFDYLRRGGWPLWRAGGLLGTVLFAAYAFQTVGLCTTTATRAGFLTGLFVVLVPLLSALVLRRPRALRCTAGRAWSGPALPAAGPLVGPPAMG